MNVVCRTVVVEHAHSLARGHYIGANGACGQLLSRIRRRPTPGLEAARPRRPDSRSLFRSD